MTKTEEKQKLRTKVRADEQKLSQKYKTRADKAIAGYLLEMPEYLAADTVFCFVGTAREINTRPILENALSLGKTLCVPLCTGPGQMDLRKISSLDDLSIGSYGILEPHTDAPKISADDVDFSVIPCLCCARDGRRLGQGGGFYDRFFTSYRGAAVLICRERLLREEIPVEPHDAVIYWVVTEKGLYEDGTPARIE